MGRGLLRQSAGRRLRDRRVLAALVLASALACLLALAPVQLARAGAVKSAEQMVRDCANRMRAAAGLPPLAASPTLTKAARLQARDMIRERFFDHRDPQGRKASDRVAEFDRKRSFIGVGENLAETSLPSWDVCAAWAGSPGHRANILVRRYTHIGTGFWSGNGQRSYVQVFATSR